jgi:DNA polymerase III alpha subunit
MNVDKRQFESLVMAGAFDKLSQEGRASLMGAIEDIVRYREAKKRYESKMETYVKRLNAYHVRNKAIDEFNELSKEERRGKKRPLPVKVPPQPEDPELPKIPAKPEYSTYDLLVSEKELLGYYVSGHPLDLVEEQRGVSVQYMKDRGLGADGKTFTLLAIPSIIKEITTKKAKKLMAYVVLEDKTGTIQSVVLPDHYAQFHALIKSGAPALYTGQLEVTQGDEDSVLKFLVKSVAPLRILEEQKKELQATIPVRKAKDVASWIRTHHGTAARVAFFIENRGNLWKVGSFGCRVPQEQVLDRLEDLSC